MIFRRDKHWWKHIWRKIQCEHQQSFFLLNMMDLIFIFYFDFHIEIFIIISFWFFINWMFFIKNVCSSIKFNLRNCFFLQNFLRRLKTNFWCYKCVCVLRDHTNWPFWRIQYWMYENRFEVKIWPEIKKHKTFHIVISLIKNNLVCEENITDNFCWFEWNHWMFYTFIIN